MTDVLHYYSYTIISTNTDCRMFFLCLIASSLNKIVTLNTSENATRKQTRPIDLVFVSDICMNNQIFQIHCKNRTFFWSFDLELCVAQVMPCDLKFACLHGWVWPLADRFDISSQIPQQWGRVILACLGMSVLQLFQQLGPLRNQEVAVDWRLDNRLGGWRTVCCWDKAVHHTAHY